MKRLQLIENNTNNNTFDFYEEVDKGRVFITQSILYVSDTIDLYVNGNNTFYIENESNDDDFTFTSESIDG